jgi:RNA polymerase sigma-70 factor, ECF subfamily
MDRQTVFLQLLAENAGRWRGIARVYDRQGAEDLLQEILLQIWRSLPGFRQQSSLKTWCYRVALNAAMTWRRSERARKTRLPIRDGFSPARIPSPPAEGDDTESLAKAMDQLPPADKAVLLLFLDEVSYADMSEILGITEGALRVRVHRIKKRLAELFGVKDDGL